MLAAYRCTGILLVFVHIHYWLQFLGYVPHGYSSMPDWANLFCSACAIRWCFLIAQLREEEKDLNGNPIYEKEDPARRAQRASYAWMGFGMLWFVLGWPHPVLVATGGVYLIIGLTHVIMGRRLRLEPAVSQ